MNIELDEVVVLDVSDDALEMAADASQWGQPSATAAITVAGCSC
jgi:hypothetical protein